MEDAAMPMDTAAFNRLIAHQRADLGNCSEMVASAAFFRAGAMVFKPLGAAKGYNIIVDDGERLMRVQVKTLSPAGNQVNIGWPRHYIEWATGAYRYEVVQKYGESSFDLLAAVDRETWEVFVVPIADIDLSKSAFSFSLGNREKYRFVAN